MMLSPECQNQETARLTHQLLAVLRQYKAKPYLPVWGELYCALRDISKAAKRLETDIVVYPINPAGTLICSHQAVQFVVDIPDPGLTITLSVDQLIDALLQGSFAPIDETPLRRKLD
jgi:hypothetical protein